LRTYEILIYFTPTFWHRARRISEGKGKAFVGEKKKEGFRDRVSENCDRIGDHGRHSHRKAI
jgi:hypothetical protein